MGASVGRHRKTAASISKEKENGILWTHNEEEEQVLGERNNAKYHTGCKRKG